MVKVAFGSTESADTQSSRKSKPAKKSRWLLKLWLLLIIAIVAAPSVVSLTGSMPTLIKKVHPKLAQAVSFGSVNMHWWAPVEVANFKLQDLSQSCSGSTPGINASLLCEAENIITIEPLWRIVLNGGRGTGVVVKSPKLNLITNEQETNIDRTITELFGHSNASGGDRFPFRVAIENGAVQLRSEPFSNVLDSTPTSGVRVDETSGTNSVALASSVIAEVTGIDATLSTMDTSRWMPALKLSASIHQVTGQPVAKRAISRPARLAAGLDELTNDFPDVPLHDLVGADASGDANAARIQIYLQPNADDKGRQAIQVGARDVDLRLIQPFLSMLGIDAMCNGMVSGGIDARLAGAELKDGVVGRIMLAGDEVRVRQSNWAADEWLPLGTVNANGAVAIAEDGMLIQDLKISTNVAVLEGSGELRHRQSDSGTPVSQSQQVELNGTVDLAAVASSLRKTLVLHNDVTVQNGEIIFQAVASANGSKDDAANSLASGSPSHSGSWTLSTRVDGLQAVRAGTPLKVDSSMKLDATGPFADGVPELLRARLTAGFGTIDCLPDGGAWKVSGLVQPASLWETVRQFADVSQPGIRGDVNFQSRVVMLSEGVQLTELQLSSSDVRANSKALTVVPSNPLTAMFDGAIHLEGSGAAIRTLLLPWFDASFLADRAQIITDLKASPKCEIEMGVRITPPGIASVSQGMMKTVSQSQTRTTSVSASVFVIDEAVVDLKMTANNDASQFDISKGTITLPGLSSQVSGTVLMPDEGVLLDLTADTSYDLETLSRRIFAADSGLVFSGQSRDVFRLKGNPEALSGVVQQAVSRSALTKMLEGSGTVQWTSANLWGLGLGGASVQGTLENSLLRTAPIQCGLNGGQMNAMAQYDIASSRLELGSGSRIENVKITSELCREWLGYVVPMLADAADINGQLSMRVERFLWDMNSPQNSDIAGQLTIHQASATPGSSLASILQVVDLLRKRDETSGLSSRSLSLPEQTVPVQVRQGYVLHDGLIMDLAGYRLKSTGAVGMNEQIQITLDVPLEKGTTSSVRTIKVPLRGTIKSPQPDTTALIQNLGMQKIQEQLGTDKIQQKVGDEIDQTLNKGLNKLLNRF
jgi:hypothetical protein